MDNKYQQTTRITESPARTIDSRDSTTESVETIVNCNSNNNNNNSNNNQKTENNNVPQQKLLENQTETMANSTNTTNNCNKNSLTNSQISMISNDQKDSHIYTTPDLVCPKVIKPTIQNTVNPSDKRKLEDTIIINKTTGQNKQPIPKFEPIDLKIPLKRKLFPIHILLGLIQLVLSIALAALGGLLIARGASLSSSASGLWSGGICAIAGALGVINLRKAQTGFLAVSLICVASSTLAMALTGIGLVRDINRLEIAEFNTQTTKAAISAGGGLVFTLVLHFLVSIISVYQSALRLCSRYDTSSSQILDNVITAHNASIISQKKVEEYINLAGNRNEKHMSHEDYEKLKAMWVHSIKRRGPPPQMKSVPSLHPVMLVPAGSNGFPSVLPPGFRPQLPPIVYSPRHYPSGCVLLSSGSNGFHPYPSMSLPPESLPPGSIYKIQSIYSGSEMNRSRRQQIKHRTGKNDPSRRQRRKSDSDVQNGKAFTYTGLDRAIADSFLERQELSNGGNDYASSTDLSRDDRLDK